ncbi:MAG: glucose-6-phosphate dehydrogenase assembly protein OpcA [Actinomycetota bacterium]|nr:glucose-6-phosphate dehydrogenase assembly protein OpcA [Actinomycetota bacterium]
MTITLTDTTSSRIAAELLRARRRAGSPAMGMVLTLVVDVPEDDADEPMRAAAAASTEHPARVLGVIRGSARGASRVDAEVSIGAGWSGETVLLRLSGEVTAHAESVVLPLLLPDSPVVVWWPTTSPADPATDPLGALAQRRITDAAAAPRGRAAALAAQCENYAPGNTDLAWTRLTGWRALLAAALDQVSARVTGGEVAAQRVSPSADLLSAWLGDRLRVEVARKTSRGPGITSVRLATKAGEIALVRPDGRLATLCTPGQPDRPVALTRRPVAELLAEELRRLDPDDVYEATVTSLREQLRRGGPAR